MSKGMKLTGHALKLVPRTPGSKYGNRKITAGDGGKFDSLAELRRWSHLQMLQRGGHISDLRRQVVFEMVPSVKFAGAARARPAIRYIADFVYLDQGIEVIEDVKGVETPEFKIKRHLMKALLGREVRVIK